jgi:hypothetical protein
MTIPVTSSRVNLDGLDPVLEFRLELMFRDPRMKGYRVISGVRTYEMQKSLYSGWRSKLAGLPGFAHYNLAANPDRKFGILPSGSYWQGSYHMVQPTTGYGHAVDITRPVGVSVGEAWSTIASVGNPLGISQTVKDEYWHVQAGNLNGHFKGPLPTKDLGMKLHIPLNSGTVEHAAAMAGNPSKVKARLYQGNLPFETTSIKHWAGVAGVTVISDQNLPTLWASWDAQLAATSDGGSTVGPSADTIADRVVAKILNVWKKGAV